MTENKNEKELTKFKLALVPIFVIPKCVPLGAHLPWVYLPCDPKKTSATHTDKVVWATSLSV